MCVGSHAWACVSGDINIHITHTYISLYVCMYERMYVCMHVCVYAYMLYQSIQLDMYISRTHITYIHMYVCI